MTADMDYATTGGYDLLDILVVDDYILTSVGIPGLDPDNTVLPGWVCKVNGRQLWVMMLAPDNWEAGFMLNGEPRCYRDVSPELAFRRALFWYHEFDKPTPIKRTFMERLQDAWTAFRG